MLGRHFGNGCHSLRFRGGGRRGGFRQPFLKQGKGHGYLSGECNLHWQRPTRA
jgi:hypothetical protein